MPASEARAAASSAARAKPTILLIHPRPFFRDCFAVCLAAACENHVVFPFESVVGWRSSAEAVAVTPSVSIIAIERQDASSLADWELLEEVPKPVIVVADTGDADQIVRTLKRGVRGYIPSHLPFNIAVEAVRLVKAGGVFVPADSLLGGEGFAPAKPEVTLTKRQIEVVEAIRQGKANKQIAYDLNMSEHTVKLHLRRIMQKLKAHNRTEVAILAEKVVRSRLI
ncbi:response regulator transcription factor [Bradyrhizobium lablabi]|uniref:response regulator transcription factor n=1 Tax=Bradyrhizobium lablabi TaxID=722472 RepID=UPI001BACF525|nr:response regulator transcription factor [Bradyrhizobium lablabi]MBR1120425.1 response regulator transcription factor [Bradyrhizobium lablabi]